MHQNMKEFLTELSGLMEEYKVRLQVSKSNENCICLTSFIMEVPEEPPVKHPLFHTVVFGTIVNHEYVLDTLDPTYHEGSTAAVSRWFKQSSRWDASKEGDSE